MTPETTDPQFDATLARSFAIAVPAQSRIVIDGRLQAAIASEAERRLVRGPRFWSASRSARRLLIGLGAVVLLTGSVAAGGTLFAQLIGGAPLLEDVWDRATVIGLSTTDSGYTIVLERAAVDPERVWVALTVTTASEPGADPAGLRVIDANGVVMDGGTGAGRQAGGGVSATLFGFRVPTGIVPRGPFILEVRSVMTAEDEQQRGDWTFEFDVPLSPAFRDSAPGVSG